MIMCLRCQQKTASVVWDELRKTSFQGQVWREKGSCHGACKPKWSLVTVQVVTVLESCWQNELKQAQVEQLHFHFFELNSTYAKTGFLKLRQVDVELPMGWRCRARFEWVVYKRLGINKKHFCVITITPNPSYMILRGIPNAIWVIKTMGDSQ